MGDSFYDLRYVIALSTIKKNNNMWSDLTPFAIFNFITQHLPGLVMVGLASLILFLYVQDKYFTPDQAIRKNYPLLGRLRYAMEHLSTFTRQYFANDRSEEPFNRAQRSWYRAAKAFRLTNPLARLETIQIKITCLETDILVRSRLRRGLW